MLIIDENVKVENPEEDILFWDVETTSHFDWNKHNEENNFSEKDKQNINEIFDIITK